MENEGKIPDHVFHGCSRSRSRSPAWFPKSHVYTCCKSQVAADQESIHLTNLNQKSKKSLSDEANMRWLVTRRGPGIW
jgi:hypothetical protein